jgi:hypothetical protein
MDSPATILSTDSSGASKPLSSLLDLGPTLQGKCPSVTSVTPSSPSLVDDGEFGDLYTTGPTISSSVSQLAESGAWAAAGAEDGAFLAENTALAPIYNGIFHTTLEGRRNGGE